MKNLRRPAADTDLMPRQWGGKTASNWSRHRKAVRDFVEWALANQNNQCTFCGFTVDNVAERRAYSVDHFAPQGDSLYPQWRFEPLNLVITCHVCNSVFKGDYDPVIVVAPSYDKCTFALVHPYLDMVSSHLVGTYAGGSQQVGAPVAGSLKGLRTIRKFRLDDPNYIVAINKQAVMFSIDAWASSSSHEEEERYLKVLDELNMLR